MQVYELGNKFLIECDNWPETKKILGSLMGAEDEIVTLDLRETGLSVPVTVAEKQILHESIVTLDEYSGMTVDVALNVGKMKALKRFFDYLEENNRDRSKSALVAPCIGFTERMMEEVDSMDMAGIEEALVDSIGLFDRELLIQSFGYSEWMTFTEDAPELTKKIALKAILMSCRKRLAAIIT